jgi:hypothetical protein
MIRLKKQLAIVAAVLLMCTGTLGLGVSSASAASGMITGTIDCFYGNNNVSGVWVNATNGADGWATLSGSGSHKSYSYTLSQSSTYALHVGCGGDPSDWGGTFYSPTVNGQSYNWVCSVTGGQMICALS